MSKIKDQCIFYMEDKAKVSCVNNFCMFHGKYIQSCPLDCRYFIDRFRAITQLVRELKQLESKSK